MRDDPTWLDYMTAFGTVGAAVAAAIATIVAALSTKQTKRLVDVEVERRAEEKTAQGTADIEAALWHRNAKGPAQMGYWKTTWLAIYNHGPADATEVAVHQSDNATEWIDEALVPKTVAPRQQIKVPLPLHTDDGDRLGTIVLSWKDESGERELSVHNEMLAAD